MAPGRGASRQREDGEIADRRPSPNFHRHHTHPRGGGRGRGGPRGGGGPRGDRLDRGGGRGLRGGAPVVVVSRYADLADDGPPVTPGRRGLEQQQQQQRGGGGRPSGPGGRGGRGARGGRGRGGRGGGDNNSNKNQNMEPMRGGGGRWHERGGRGDARHARGRGDGRGNTSGRGGPRGGGDHQRPFKRRRSPSPTPPLLGKGISQRAQSFGSEGEILTDTELSPVQTPAQRPPDPPPMMNNIMRGNNSNHNNNRNNNFNAMRGNGPPQDSFRNNNNNNNFHNNANANRRNSTGDGSRSLNDDSASMARRTSMPVSHHGQSPRGPPVHDSYGRMALTPPPQQQQQARSRSSQPQHNNEESSLSSVRRSPGDESVSSRRPSGPTRTMDRNKEAQPLPSHSNSAVYDDSSTSTLNRPTNGGPSSNRPPPSSIDHNKSKDEPVRQRQQQRPPPPSSLSSPRPPPSTPHGVSRGTPVVRSYSNLPEEVVAAAAPRAGSGTVLPLPPAPQKQPPELPPQQNQQQPQAQPVSTTDGRQRHHDGSVESGPPRGASTSTTNVHQPPRPPVSEINMPPRPNNNKTTTTMMMMGDRRGGGRSDDRGRLGMRGGRGGRSRGDFGRGNFGGRSDFFPDDMHSNKKFGGRVGGRGRGGDRGRGGGMDFGRGRGELGRGRAPIYSAMSAGSENEMNSFDGNMRGRGRGDFRGGRGGRGRDDFGRGRGRDSFDLRSGRERGMEFGMRDPGFNNDSFSFEGGGRGRGFGRTGGRGRADFTSVRQLPPPNSISVPQPQHRGKGGLNEQRAREMGHQARDATSRIFDQPFDQRFHNNGDPMGQSPFPQRNQNHDESDRQTFRSLDETRPESSNARDPNKATPQSSTEPSIAKSETVGTSANGMDVSPQQGSATESKMEESLAPPLICTPPPGEPSRLTLALTRLADLEAQMEFEFVKHSQLVLDQKKIRAEYETLLGMPVGKESFQSDYDLLIGETEQSQ